MNTRILAAVVAAASFVSASAFADARYNDNTPDIQVQASQLTRAEVRSELAQAAAAGQLNQVETGTPLIAASQAQKAVPANALTRADVRAQLSERALLDRDSRS
ncbi:DUF4148 domain-containing protein [Pandoraea nosoerga]|uniref:DUF4148 domain-containing protein n=1 Tax=Pandoraea nosoerga TaxID=2508296 RepID=A0A5E4UCD2_9BURK|nr:MULTISPECIES: DUF4148 domain-containing protein [Pandoraea]MBN4667125.1 DUF4148 domain-containing protein [Pandoraea nosoerga]MBN4677114.1 DUF4148 domain-containing protein [Pandoraea nosoerga]MBN4681850.1 DUF4148 domain-containing protein [Pandoraea nosoerga]MBN4746230.1 DUF4148 domain-containing protein [Pandoraea nosoerga]VVD97690.1 hypothetical protein PNO31109_01948 [Pandoraea nosoerga]